MIQSSDVRNYQYSIPVMWCSGVFRGAMRQRRLYATRLNELMLWKSARRKKIFTYATWIFVFGVLWLFFLFLPKARAKM